MPKANFYRNFIIILAVVFFILASFLSWSTILPGYFKTGMMIYNWPDAMANQAFVNEFIQNNDWKINLPTDLPRAEIIHPRSTNVFNGAIVPASFSGLIVLYGLIGKIIQIPGTIFLTPLLSALCIYLFFSFFKRLFNERMAFWSSVGLILLPAFLYFANQPMLHQILFIFLLMASVRLLLVEKRKTISIFFSGLILGFAIWTRTTEIIWLLPGIALTLYFQRANLTKKNLGLYFGGLLIGILPIFIFNYFYYGSIMSFGYLRFNSGSLVNQLPSEFTINKNLPAGLQYLQSIFLPFGFHPRLIWSNFINYFVSTNVSLIVFILFGDAIFLFQKNKDQKQTQFAIMATMCSAIILLYYGSWLIEDPQVRMYNVISNSMVRYFLPAMIFALPAIGYFIDWILTHLSSKIRKGEIIILFVFCSLIFNIDTVWLAGYDGLIKVSQDLNQYQNRHTQVSNQIEKNAIIITDKMDKAFFPQYPIIVYPLSSSDWSAVYNFNHDLPIYLLTPDQGKALTNIRMEITSNQMDLIPAGKIDNEYQLFKIK